MKKVAFLLVLIFLLFACVFNNTSYNDQLQKWVGQPESSLIASWGRPTLEKNISAQEKVLIYVQYQNILVPTEYFYNQPMWGADDMIYSPFFGEYAIDGYDQIQDESIEGICQTTFNVIAGTSTGSPALIAACLATFCPRPA